jgi:hypothetical protein
MHDDYNPAYRVVNYENIFIHLEEMNKNTQYGNMKYRWIKDCYNRLMNIE